MIQSLNQILDAMFVQQAADQAISLIRKYDLEKLFTVTIVQINRILNNRTSKSDDGDITPISVAFLIGINDVVGSIADKREKHQLKYLVAQIADSILNQYIFLNPQNATQVMSKIVVSLHNACELRGYDKEDLRNYLPLESKAATVAATTKGLGKMNVKEQDEPWYEWSGTKIQLKNLLKLLAEREVILSRKEFEKLFSVSKVQHDIKTNPEKADYLLMLAAILTHSEPKWFQPKVNKGHFHPLASHLVDLEGKKLFKTPPKGKFYGMRKNKLRWQRAKTFVGIILQQSCLKEVDLELTLTKVNAKKGKS